MALSRDQLKAGAARYKSKTREVHVKELADPDSGDDVVLVRGLSALEWDAHQAAVRIMGENGQQVGLDESNVSAKLAVRVMVDDAGVRLLNDSDAAWLGESSPSDVAEILNAALELSGMTPAGGASEETKGNSEPAQSGGPSSESPETTERPQPSSSAA